MPSTPPSEPTRTAAPPLRRRARRFPPHLARTASRRSRRRDRRSAWDARVSRCGSPAAPRPARSPGRTDKRAVTQRARREGGERGDREAPRAARHNVSPGRRLSPFSTPSRANDEDLRGCRRRGACFAGPPCSRTSRQYDLHDQHCVGRDGSHGDGAGRRWDPQRPTDGTPFLPPDRWRRPASRLLNTETPQPRRIVDLLSRRLSPRALATRSRPASSNSRRLNDPSLRITNRGAAAGVWPGVGPYAAAARYADVTRPVLRGSFSTRGRAGLRGSRDARLAQDDRPPLHHPINAR